jgi:hypothetical protein
MEALSSVIGERVTADTYQSTFRRWARTHHPNKGGDPEKFKLASSLKSQIEASSRPRAPLLGLLGPQRKRINAPPVAPEKKGMSSVIESRLFSQPSQVAQIQKAIARSLKRKTDFYAKELDRAIESYRKHKALASKTRKEIIKRAQIQDELSTSNKLALARNLANRVPELVASESLVARIRVILRVLDSSNPGDLAQQLVQFLIENVSRIKAQPSLDEYMLRLFASFTQGSGFEGYMNVALMGPAGSGKTSSAELLAKFFELSGMLVGGMPFTVGNPSTLLSEYMGGTTSKTVKAFSDSMESVLFIDEAYGLTKSGEHGYGDEAIVAALTQMDRFKGRHVFMIAGYQKQIMEMLDTNEGLSRRFPNKVYLVTLGPKQLYEIFVKTVTSSMDTPVTDRIKAMRKYFMDTELRLFPNSAGDVMVLAERFMNTAYEKDLLKLYELENNRGWFGLRDDPEKFARNVVEEYKRGYLRRAGGS